MNEIQSANKKKDRILAIDYLKAISIIFVVFSHINNYNSSAKIWTVCFAANAFFFSHGMVFRQKISKRSDWKDFILNRLISIMAPYLIWAMIYASFDIKNVLKIAYSSHESLSLAGSLTSLWFLPCLFAADIIFELILCIADKFSSKKGKSVLIIAAMILIMAVCAFIPHPAKGWPFEADVALQAAVWIGAGYLTMAVLKNKIASDNGKKTNIFILLLIAAAGFALSLTAFINTSMPGGYVMVAEARYGNYLLYIASAAGGTVFSVALSFILARIKNTIFIKTFQLIGQNTMIIFAIHKFVVFTLQDVMSGISIPDAAAAAVILVSAIVISLVFAPLINTYMPLLAGKMKYKRIFGEK